MARAFNGSNQGIVFTSIADQENLTTVSFSIWIYRSGAGGSNYGRMFGHSDSGVSTDQWKFENDNGDGALGLGFIANWTTADGSWYVAYPTNNTWTNYVITYDGGSTANNPIIYKNGVSATVTENTAPSGSLGSTDEQISIGAYVDGTSVSWNGRLCEFGYWNRVLTAGEALGIGKGFSPAFYKNGLVFYAPLLGRESPEPDVKSGLTGTVTGATNTSHPPIIYPTGSNGWTFSPGGVAVPGPIGKIYAFPQAIQRANYY